MSKRSSTIRQVAFLLQPQQSYKSARRWITTRRGNPIKSLDALCPRVQARKYATSGFDPRFCPYETLGVDKASSAEDIKKAFFRLAKEHHPDTARSDRSKDRFVLVSRAYELVGTPDKRARYDRERALWSSNSNRFGPHHPHQPFGGGSGGRMGGYDAHHYDPFQSRDGTYGRFYEYETYPPTGGARTRPADATRLWVVLGAFAFAGVSLTFWHITRMRELVLQSMNLKEREALVYYEESRRRAREGKKGLGADVLEAARLKRKEEENIEGDR